jgi:hypothetical protein
MKLQLGSLSLNLAKTPAPKTTTEQGTSSDAGVPTLFEGETISRDKITTKDMLGMLDNDGTASAMYMVITEPIKANTWDIEPFDNSPEAKKQADEVREAMTLPPHMGGMTTPMSLVIADMLRAIIEGNRKYEKVFELRNGRIVYQKIAPRDDSSTVILQDDRGGFNGLRQRAYIGKEYKTVTIDRQYSFVFTYRKEFATLMGKSAFRAAYYHYEKKHRLYYIANQMAQFGALPPKKVTAPKGAKQKDIDLHVALADQLGVSSTIGLPDGWELDAYDAAKGRYDPMGLIDHHNAEMARSILAQFMMLGTGGSTGSWALSKDQSDMFIIALRGVMNSIEEHINSYVLPDLVNYNYESPKYPRFKFANLTDATVELLKEAMTLVFNKIEDGKLPEDLVTGVMDKLRTQLDITNNTETPGLSRKGGQHTHFLADKRWSRPLTPAEKKVNFAALDKKYNELDKQFAQATKPIFDKIRQDTVKRLEKLLEAKDYKALDSFDIKTGPEYKKLLLDQMIDAYGYAKNGAADELNVGTPSTPNQSREIIRQQASQTVDKQLADLAFNVKSLVTEALRKNQLSKAELAIGDVLANVGGAVTGFYEEKIQPTSSVVFGTAINLGRDDVFVANRNKISKYQYSAIMDGATCAICMDLDGTIVDEAEYRSTQWMPPIHFSCRCIWVAIMSDEEEQPDITGFPDHPGDRYYPMFDGPGSAPAKPFDNFKDENLETIAQADIAGRPNAAVNTQIEELLKSNSPGAIRDSIRLAISLPQDDAIAMLDSITLPSGKGVGNFFYSVKLKPDGKIGKVLIDAAKDPLKMTAEQIASMVGLPTS